MRLMKNRNFAQIETIASYPYVSSFYFIPEWAPTPPPPPPPFAFQLICFTVGDTIWQNDRTAKVFCPNQQKLTASKPK